MKTIIACLLLVGCATAVENKPQAVKDGLLFEECKRQVEAELCKPPEVE